MTQIPERLSALMQPLKRLRTVQVTPPELAPSDPYQRALALSRMGLYKKAVDVFNQAEPTHQNDYWFMHDMAVALTALGGEKNVSQAIASRRVSLNKLWEEVIKDAEVKANS